MADNRQAQNIARETMEALKTFIRPGVSEKEIETYANRLMEAKGSNSWWYHGIGSLVLLGERSDKSYPWREFFASDSNRVADFDVITIDLAPTVDGFWGDYARTIFVERGEVVMDGRDLVTPEFREGHEMELHLHDKLLDIARPDHTLEEIFYLLNEEITRCGYLNLDNHGNLGHTVEVMEYDRIYLEKGEKRTFRELGKMFTFEPHIQKRGGKYGIKRENIYYFEGDKLVCL